MIIIYRYSNRKLYNTKEKKYITLKGVLELLNKGDDIKVVDRTPTKYTTGPFKDITVNTVTKAFFQAGLFHSTVKDFLDLRRNTKGVDLWEINIWNLIFG